ncbi:hypothetical protein V6N13_071316 [Hibiscus sabdariffa]
MSFYWLLPQIVLTHCNFPFQLTVSYEVPQLLTPVASWSWCSLNRRKSLASFSTFMNCIPSRVCLLTEVLSCPHLWN